MAVVTGRMVSAVAAVVLAGALLVAPGTAPARAADGMGSLTEVVTIAADETQYRMAFGLERRVSGEWEEYRAPGEPQPGPWAPRFDDLPAGDSFRILAVVYDLDGVRVHQEYTDGGIIRDGSTETASPALLGAPLPVLSDDYPTENKTISVSAEPWVPGQMIRFEWWLAPNLVGTGPTFRPTRGGTHLKVKVIAENPPYPTVVRETDYLPVQSGEQFALGTPTFEGVLAVGRTLTAKPGVWSPVPAAFGYTWYRGGRVIEGATKATYTLVPDDLMAWIAVSVSASAEAYHTSHVWSVERGPVEAGALTTTAIPTISGSATLGSTLTAHPGKWGPGAMTFAYQWLHDGAPIEGATKSTYVVRTTDARLRLAVMVTGSAPGYAATSTTSVATAAVPGQAMTVTPVPTISGKAQVGKKLTIKPGTWQPRVSFTYTWFRDGKKISDWAASHYTLVGADKGKRITVKVTGNKPGFEPVTKKSKPTKPVTIGTLTTATPTIAGTAKVGRTLTAKPGTWKPSGLRFGYQWYRSGKKIAKATKSTYLLGPSYKGRKITVKVTGKKSGYATIAKTSKATSAVKAK